MNMGRKDGGGWGEKAEKNERERSEMFPVTLYWGRLATWLESQVTTDFGSHTKEFELYLLGIWKSKK